MASSLTVIPRMGLTVIFELQLRHLLEVAFKLVSWCQITVKPKSQFVIGFSPPPQYLCLKCIEVPWGHLHNFE